MMPTRVSGVGRPAEDSRSSATVPSPLKWSAGAMVEIIIGASVCPNSWPITGPILRSASWRRETDMGAAPYHMHWREARLAEARAG
jgi:hypothetical protein